jgi:hypothetical protein
MSAAIMSDFLQKAIDFIDQIHVLEQIKDVDAVGLFTNPWFLVPFIGFMGYLVYKKSWRDIIIIAICIVVWWVTGTEYMQSLIVKGELQVEKVLPVVAGGAVALGVVIYLLFGRSD